MPQIDDDKKSNRWDRAAKNLPTDGKTKVVNLPLKKKEVDQQKPSGDKPRNRSKPQEARNKEMKKRLDDLKNKGKISKYSIT
jgi:hypothetical protein